MTDKKTRWSTDERIHIVLQKFNPEAKVAEICCEHSLAPSPMPCAKHTVPVAGSRRNFA